MITGVIFKYYDVVPGAFGKFVQRVNVTKRAAKVWPRPIRADVNVKPDFTIVIFGQLKDFLLRGQCCNPASCAVDVEGVFDRLAVSEIADYENDLRIARPNCFSNALELLKIAFI